MRLILFYREPDLKQYPQALKRKVVKSFIGEMEEKNHLCSYIGRRT